MFVRLLYSSADLPVRPCCIVVVIVVAVVVTVVAVYFFFSSLPDRGALFN
jgi:hypothetical protein